MRAMLCRPGRPQPAAAELVEGSGISGLERSPADELFSRVKHWVEQHGHLDVLLCGMVGSNIGWREAPYLPCPVSLAELRDHLVTFEAQGHRVAIVPGVSCTNAMQQPDVIRGEETQVLGWQMRYDSPASGDRLLCLPGTHTKWVQLSGGLITRFTTSVTGELFDLLCRHSVLVGKNAVDESAPFDEDAYRRGVDVAHQYGDDLLHVLFSTRSRGLAGSYKSDDKSSYLSGLVIGADVRSAIRADPSRKAGIQLIGSPELCRKFAIAIDRIGAETATTDGNEAVRAGLTAIAWGDHQ